MIDLVARQVQILRSIIEEFINTAQPVGSDTIDKKYNIGVSPATIRNEMVYLTKQGYLKKAHASSGRVPTALAMRLYVNELMKEKELSVADEVSAKEKIWKCRRQVDDLLNEVARALAEKSRALGIVITHEMRLYHSGYANLLNMPEFFDINVTRNVFSLIEQANLIQDIISQVISENPIKIVYGSELGNKDLNPIAFIFTNVSARGQQCYFGVIGSKRFDYPYIIPTIKYFRALIEEIV